MEKKEKEEKEGEDVSRTLSPGVEAMLGIVNKSPDASKALRQLVKAGCDRDKLLTALYWYCGDLSGEVVDGKPIEGPGGLKITIEAVLKDARNFAKRLGDVSNQLKRVPGEVERLLVELQEKANIRYHDPQTQNLPSLSRAFADHLDRYRRGLQKSIREMRVGKDGTRVGGRKEYLFYLWCLVFDVTDEPYPLIARLVAAVERQESPNYVQLANTLRRSVDRFLRKNPAVAMMNVMEVGDYLEPRNLKSIDQQKRSSARLKPRTQKPSKQIE